MKSKHFIVTPAEAGVQGDSALIGPWVPAFAGTTKLEIQYHQATL